MTHTIEQLEAMIAEAAAGPWRHGLRYNSVVSDHPTGHDDIATLDAYGGHLVCESVNILANATLIAAAPTLATELIAALKREAQLREALKNCADELESEIEARYPPHLLEYPHNQQKMKNDLEWVYQARVLATEPAP